MRAWRTDDIRKNRALNQGLPIPPVSHHFPHTCLSITKVHCQGEAPGWLLTWQHWQHMQWLCAAATTHQHCLGRSTGCTSVALLAPAHNLSPASLQDTALCSRHTSSQHAVHIKISLQQWINYGIVPLNWQYFIKIAILFLVLKQILSLLADLNVQFSFTSNVYTPNFLVFICLLT